MSCFLKEIKNTLDFTIDFEEKQKLYDLLEELREYIDDLKEKLGGTQK